MRKHIRLTALLAALVMLLSLLPAASAVTFEEARTGFVMEKISHPEKELSTADGIVDYVGEGVVSALDQGQGDRGQNYSWSAIGYGDCVYIGTCYNAMGSTLTFMDSVLGHDFDTEDMHALLDVLYNGHFYTAEPDGGNPGGVLVKINTKTGDVKILMSRSETGDSPLFRNACQYQDKLYFCGSVNGLPMIYQVDPATDTVTPVYQGISQAEYYQCYLQGICTGIRGLCEFDGQLIISTVTMDGAKILSSTEPWLGQEAFTEIADMEDLFGYPAYHFVDSIYGGSIWEMVEFNGSLYVSLCTGTPDNMPDENTMQSFALVRGDQAADGSWTWTSVIGDQEKDGARYTFGIDPERTRAGAGVLTVWGDHLYIGEYNDEQIGIEGILFDFDGTFMNANLDQSVSLYRMDKEENIEKVMGDPTEMFPTSLSGIGSGFGRRENQYIWRMNVHDGKLYVGTFDTSSLLHPVTQLVNGDLASMSPEEWQRLISFIRALMDLQNGEGEGANAIRNALEQKTDAQLAQMFAGKSQVQLMAQPMATDYAALYAAVVSLAEVAVRTRNAERGFDLYVTEDGVNFETLTTNGFGDPYNHGCRVFANTAGGMVIGTANPFYGTQVWFMEDEEPDAPTEPTEPTDPVEPPVCDGGEDCPSAHLTDVEKPSWYHLAVDYCVENGIMQGIDATTFGVALPTNRAQLVTMLWRQAGQPEPAGEAPFTDVPADSFYAKAVAWAWENGVINGVSATEFAPARELSREQMATILFRYAGNVLGIDVSARADLRAYPDAETVSGFARDAMSWAVAEGLINGMPQGDGIVLNPQGTTNRAQMATIFQRFCENIL